VNEGKYRLLFNRKLDSRHYGILLPVEEKEKVDMCNKDFEGRQLLKWFKLGNDTTYSTLLLCQV